MENLAGKFLVAMPNLADPNFKRVVAFICMHNSDGVVGIVINRLLDLKLGDVIMQMDCKTDDLIVQNMPVFQGGPVQTDRGFILHSPLHKEMESTIDFDDHISISTSRLVLKAIAEGDGPNNTLVALGYSGWSSEQLEEEIRSNVWIQAPADPSVMFRTPINLRWQKATALAGIDIEKLSYQMGSA